MNEYFMLGLSLACIGFVCALLFLTSRTHPVVKMSAAAIIMGGFVRAWISAAAIFGYPISCMPANGTPIYSIVIDKKDDAIFLWIGGHHYPLSCSIPYDQALADRLTKAREQARSSGGVMVWADGGGRGKAGSLFGSIIEGHTHAPPVKIDVVPAMPSKA